MTFSHDATPEDRIAQLEQQNADMQQLISDLQARVNSLSTRGPGVNHVFGRNPLAMKYASLGSQVFTTLKAGAAFDDTLGKFFPIVIDKTGDITINSSENHLSALRFHNTTYSVYEDHDMTMYLGPNQEIIIQDENLGTDPGNEVAWLVLRGNHQTNGANLFLENEGTGTTTQVAITFYLRGEESVSQLRGGFTYSADVAGAATNDVLMLNMWNGTFQVNSFFVLRNGAQVDFGADVNGRMTAATDTHGFFFVPAFAGAPTGVPAADSIGSKAMMYDRTNNRLYVYNGGWKSVALA